MTVDVNNPSQVGARVWLDGEDVSRWCVYADDSIGLVKLYRHDDRGILAPARVDRHFGDVRIELGSPTLQESIDLGNAIVDSIVDKDKP